MNIIANFFRNGMPISATAAKDVIVLHLLLVGYAEGEEQDPILEAIIDPEGEETREWALPDGFEVTFN